MVKGNPKGSSGRIFGSRFGFSTNPLTRKMPSSYAYDEAFLEDGIRLRFKFKQEEEEEEEEKEEEKEEEDKIERQSGMRRERDDTRRDKPRYFFSKNNGKSQ